MTAADLQSLLRASSGPARSPSAGGIGSSGSSMRSGFLLIGVLVAGALLVATTSPAGSWLADQAQLAVTEQQADAIRAPEPASGGAARPATPGRVQRAIVPDALASLAAELKARGIMAVTAVDCSGNLLKPLKKAGVALTCLPPATEGGAFARSLTTAAAASGRGGTAIVRVTRDGAPPGLAERMQAAQLLHAGDGPAVYAEVAVNVTSGQPMRAAMLDMRSGERRLWVTHSREYLDRFNRIYATQEWGSWGGGSGLGSTLNYTGAARARAAGGCVGLHSHAGVRHCSGAVLVGERRWSLLAGGFRGKLAARKPAVPPARGANGQRRGPPPLPRRRAAPAAPPCRDSPSPPTPPRAARPRPARPQPKCARGSRRCWPSTRSPP
jgi:hypothetical protein